MNKRVYALVTAAYWGFTMTDGALRMLVLLHFHEQGLSPITLAFLFLLYEFCGVLTNALGGWWAARSGLKVTLITGLGLQVVALVSLSFVNLDWVPWLVITYIMSSQALAGVAKDLTKMSAKSAVKILTPSSATNQTRGLFYWVSILTGSKNALKGVGFLLGGVLLSLIGFQETLWLMAGSLAIVLIFSSILIKGTLGTPKTKTGFRELFSKTREINLLAAARVFLFASRDVWFVVGLPVFLKAQLNWSFDQVGLFMAAWVIGYGIVQASAPRFAKNANKTIAAKFWVWGLVIVSLTIAGLVQFGIQIQLSILLGLLIFGIVFAMNSALHSYLILAYADNDKVALNVGFYYMANAWGRLFGTLLSGLSYQWGGLTTCLWVSAGTLFVAAIITTRLPITKTSPATQ